ncbi:hypothetical protein ALC57_15726 [Trachymyrmex cornetzi]|uniref:Uncharacterized protein n=1 Tax=Trachymyrmex cornetzi TaxID=471704 RepID=A0A151IWF3_9HYME|nr:hypothetical protein ALC57_15726 [Trachymyrmex cornetzi]
MAKFSVVEFEDGLDLVPSSWLTNDSKCYYPPYEEDKFIRKAVSNCEEVDFARWTMVNIVRIFTTANTYESGMKKVKLAEEMSDIDSSDAENHKYKRRCRTRKIIESDDESDNAIFSLPLPPKKPTSVLSRQNSLKNLNAKQVQKNKSNNKVIQFKKELLRTCNQIKSKLDRIDGRLQILEEIENNNTEKKIVDLDVYDFVDLPLQTIEDVRKLDLDLKNERFYNSMVKV